MQIRVLVSLLQLPKSETFFIINSQNAIWHSMISSNPQWRHQSKWNYFVDYRNTLLNKKRSLKKRGNGGTQLNTTQLCSIAKYFDKNGSKNKKLGKEIKAFFKKKKISCQICVFPNCMPNLFFPNFAFRSEIEEGAAKCSRIRVKCVGQIVSVNEG